MDEHGNLDEFHEARKRKRSPIDHDTQPSLPGLASTQDQQDGNEFSAASGTNGPGSTKRTRHMNTSSGLASLVKEDPSSSQGQFAMSALPPELLQHIFSFLDPVSLGRLLSVGKTFNTLLDPRKPLPQSSGFKRHFSIQSQDSIWAASRKLYHPGFPRPLGGISEYEMWKLIRGHGCQFCGKRSASRNIVGPPSPWNAGPGPEQVRIVWPFAVRTCGKCLEPNLVKDTELLFSTFSSLMPAIPFAFFTPSLNYVTSITLRHSSVPPGLNLTKYYFHPQVDEVKSKLVEVRSLGLATAEEWYKGLENAGQEKASDAARFEQWEATGGAKILSAASSTTTTPGTGTPDSAFVSRNTLHLTVQSHNNAGTPRPPVTRNLPPMVAHIPPPAPGTLPNFPLKPMTPSPGQYSNQTQNLQVAPGMPLHAPQPKLDRTIRDVNQMKADRRAEIERRCLELEPPIRPATLMYMDAFAAAIQIPMTLNENAWQLLKTRLISQRRDAEAKEEEQRLDNVHLYAKNEERRQQEEPLRVARESVDRFDRDPDEIQKPTREKITRYADDFIDSQWDGGKLVKRDNAPQFAADILMYIRKRFVEELEQEDSQLPSQRPLYQLGTYTETSSRTLKLEDMKWVYETKIKPITEHFRRELFLCSVCEHTSKYYAFDAVVQHYAAKHTMSLSHGTAIVYWKSEWPEEPPFDPQPSSKILNRHPDYLANGTSPMYSEYGYATNTATDRRNPMHEYMFPPGIDHNWSRPAFSPMISAQRPVQHGFYDQSLPPKPAYNAANGAPHFQHDTPAHQAAFATHLARPVVLGQHETTSPRFPADRSAISDRSPHSQEQAERPISAVANTSQLGYSQATTSIPNGRANVHPKQGPTSTGPTGQPLGIYHMQIDDLAHHAREIWDGTEGIDALPSSVRIQVIILHVVIRFSEKYTNEPSLGLFMDALNNDSRMQPLRMLNNLTCKTCSESNATFLGQGQSSTMPVISYTLPGLLSHFEMVHIEFDRSHVVSQPTKDMARPDWKLNMIELPPPATMANFLQAPGITDAKLRIIASVLPEFFTISPTAVQNTAHADDVSIAQAGKPSHSPLNLQSQPALVGLSNMQQGRGMDLIIQSQQRTSLAVPPSLNRHITLESAPEDEYDPHRPAPYSPPARFEANGRFLPLRAEPAYARRAIYQDTQADAYLGEPSYAFDRRQPQIVYRYRDYPVHEPIPRYQPEYHLRDRVERLSPRRPSRDRMYRSEQQMNPRDTYTPRRSLNFVDEREVASPLEDRVKRETIADPSHEAIDATEQFLNNFDKIAAESYPQDETTMSSHDFASGERAGDRRAGSRPDGATHLEHEPVEMAHPESRLGSLRATPMELRRSRDDRERSRSPHRPFSRRPEQEINFGKDGQDNEGFVQRSTSTFRYREPENEDADEKLMSRERTEVIEYDQNGLPVADPQLGTLQAPNVGYYRDRSPPRIYQQRRMVAPAPPEIYGPHLGEGRPRYAEARPTGQYRYIDDERYYDGAYEPVEYVRVAPRQPHLAGGYYVERPRDPPLEYVERERQTHRDQIYERDGHLYRSIPPPERRYDPYEMPARY